MSTTKILSFLFLVFLVSVYPTNRTIEYVAYLCKNQDWHLFLAFFENDGEIWFVGLYPFCAEEKSLLNYEVNPVQLLL